jgi:hypothetical protein
MPNHPYQLLTILDYKSYFEGIVSKANFLDNFYYGYAELTDAGKKERGGTILVLEPYSNSIAGGDSDNVMGTRRGMFVIARKATAILDIPAIQDACEILCYKVMGKIKRDSKAHILRTEITNWSGYETGTVTAARYVGYALEFTFHAPINRFMVAEPGEWEE